MPNDRAIPAALAAQRDAAEVLFAQLRNDGLDEPGTTRDPYGPGEQRAHATVATFADSIGLHVARDAAANLYMTLPGRDRTAPPLILGSHLDSVPHGGNFDGAAGVVAGLAAVRALQHLGITPSCDLTVMAIRAEESIWFQLSYIGSRAALGTLPDSALNATRIDTGRTLAEHIAECGGNPDTLRRGECYLDPARIRAYLELHIEQAPSLVEAGVPIAICTAIPGNFRYPAGSKAATITSACPSSFATTRQWPARSSRWPWTASGTSMKRAGSPWPARSAASIPTRPTTD